ncbi:Uncharacterised protein [Acholeplasma oculi]|uniref:Uncharacterized protein n=1 Tax=Acholeplasma oculi TaxID=35623 RepID=A0A061ADH1_9MOLU|nr:polymorphic toxin type 24 domain-containing protein [Acholeplasma oculi]CDR31479.1 hypothetical protein Aocu_14060 [Acholeplasma oculi]SKC49168.1 toxin 24 [Acholeplasma oculi]SUT92195.1 Uncharacterised protein [Acholeplasma oculi]
MAFGPVGWIIGTVGIIAGIATIAFGGAEILQHFTSDNWIQDSTGWDNELYNGLYIGVNILSTITTVGGNIYKKHMTRTGTSSTPNTGKKYTRYIQNSNDGSPMRVTQYNGKGNQSWRIDYVGRSHGGFSTPHKVIYAYNKNGQPVKNLIRYINWTKKIHWWYI